MTTTADLSVLWFYQYGFICTQLSSPIELSQNKGPSQCEMTYTNTKRQQQQVLPYSGSINLVSSVPNSPSLLLNYLKKRGPSVRMTCTNQKDNKHRSIRLLSHLQNSLSELFASSIEFIHLRIGITILL